MPGLLAGVISDTHGYVDPALRSVFASVDVVLHAGDVGGADVLEFLASIAPVVAVRGNVDREGPTSHLPERIDLTLNGVGVHLVHRPQDAAPAADSAVVIHGHSHRPLVEFRERILYLNPGAAGRQGFHRERTVALLQLQKSIGATIVSLGPRSQPRTQGTRKSSA